ncbi:MAG: MarR family transcriptional regulator [Bacteroidales bacterium]|nr:MarR family transcriptional regulator [Bacteroidales bacterium]
MVYEQLKLDNQLCFRLYAASRLVIQMYEPWLSKLGLTYPQYLVMLVLWEKNKMPVNDIAHRLLLETNTVTPLLKRMEVQKLIVRKRDGQDHRKIIVGLTHKGLRMKELAKEIPLEMSCQLQCMVSTPEQQEEMMKMAGNLDRLIETLCTRINNYKQDVKEERIK